MAFLCLIGAASAGAFSNVRLPSKYLQEDTIEIVTIVVNIFVVMTSLAIGLMLTSAKTTFETNDRNVHALATEIILLDRTLRTLGPEADEARRHLVEYAQTALNEANLLEADPYAEGSLDAAGTSLRAIKASDDQRLALWNDARRIYRQVVRERWVLVDAAGGTIPAPLIVMLILWLAAVFVGLGYRAPRNAVVTTTFVVAALLLSGADWAILHRDRTGPLFAQLERGDIVIAVKLDRLFRSALDALRVVESLKTRGVKLHLLDLGGDIAGNGLSKLFLTIAAAFAEAERDRIRERIGQVKADQKARGRYLGGKVPFGFRRGDDGELVPHEAEQEAIREMAALRAQGEALRAIATAMAAKGHRISHEGVAGVLRAAGQAQIGG